MKPPELIDWLWISVVSVSIFSFLVVRFRKTGASRWWRMVFAVITMFVATFLFVLVDAILQQIFDGYPGYKKFLPVEYLYLPFYPLVWILLWTLSSAGEGVEHSWDADTWEAVESEERREKEIRDRDFYPHFCSGDKDYEAKHPKHDLSVLRRQDGEP